MIVDDRLETVLRTVAAGPGAIRTQFRQLADILGRVPAESWGAPHGAALDRINAFYRTLGDASSAALLATCTQRSPILVEHFANLGPKTALAAITGARLHETEWLQLIPDLPVQARGFLRHRRDLGPQVQALLARFGITDFALPLPAGYEPLVTAQPAAAPPVTPPQPVAVPAAPQGPSPTQGEGIGAIVRRIEAFRRTREAQTARIGIAGAGIAGGSATSTGQTRLPFADEPAEIAHDLTTISLRLDREGTVIAADAPQPAMLIGLRPFAADVDAPVTCDAASLRAAQARQPVGSGILKLEGTGGAAGTWRIDAVPLFAPEAGHFLGYSAQLRRPPATRMEPAANDDAAAASKGNSADRLRQMLHELRTPINAIQGFAELIQQQLLGPTPHQYRSLAAGIASDAARMLAGFEDIERLAGLESGLLKGEPGETDLAALLGRLVQQLEPVLAPREVRLRCDIPENPVPVAIEPLELERTLWRMLSLIAGSAAPGERLALSLEAKGTAAELVLPLPAALAMRDDAALLAPDAGGAGGANSGSSSGGAMLGGGFALRLAAAEVRAAGGALTRRGAQLVVTLPLLTAARQTPSHSEVPTGQAGRGQSGGPAGQAG